MALPSELDAPVSGLTSTRSYRDPLMPPCSDRPGTIVARALGRAPAAAAPPAPAPPAPDIVAGRGVVGGEAAARAAEQSPPPLGRAHGLVRGTAPALTTGHPGGGGKRWGGHNNHAAAPLNTRSRHPCLLSRVCLCCSPSFLGAHTCTLQFRPDRCARLLLHCPLSPRDANHLPSLLRLAKFRHARSSSASPRTQPQQTNLGLVWLATRVRHTLYAGMANQAGSCGVGGGGEGGGAGVDGVDGVAVAVAEFNRLLAPCGMSVAPFKVRKGTRCCVCSTCVVWVAGVVCSTCVVWVAGVCST